MVYLRNRTDDITILDYKLYLVTPIKYSVADLQLPKYTIIYLRI